MPAPTLTAIHHFSPTVSDIDASVAWYATVLGMERVPAPFPHHGDEKGGYAVLLMNPAGFAVGLHHHEANPGETYHESHTGLDHIAFGVASREDLEAWAAWLDECGVVHSGVVDAIEPVPYSVIVFRDPDGIQLELFHMAA
ncbi:MULTISPECIES: VOC family protein [unclassified Pseudonocardia]|uniref:VOC family protein n=1 Tax=unclassified Pseudonocardia TaxID=2619320 RepID=UPI00094B2726|nr:MULTISPECIES: VOC family protein [unclassified Pseudonocardia]